MPVHSEPVHSFAALLRQHRQNQALSQEVLAERAGLSVRGLSDLERGARRSPQPGTVSRLASALGLDAEARAALASAARPSHAQPAEAGTEANPSPAVSALPVSLSSFVGRQRELAHISVLLDHSRLVTLTGAGGIGKTRLAVELARRAGASSPTLPMFVELASISDGQSVARVVAAAFGLSERQTRSTLDLLAEHIGNQSLLLVLDNCEHLLDGCAELVEYLLRACANLRVLTTTREPLHVAGEVRCVVPPLDLSSPDGEAEAVRLFVERAQAVQPEFRLDEETAAFVGDVCQRLDGMPLAIELAAARVRALSIEQIALRLDDRFGLLVGGTRTSLPRQRTLLATLEWSYSLLAAAERAVLGRLAVFAGGCCLEAVEAVCADAPLAGQSTLDILTSLVDKSLVLAERVSGSGEVRYRLLETVREFAANRLREAGEDDAARGRHLAWVIEFSERTMPLLVGRDQVRWLKRVSQEHDNFLRALEWSREQANTEAELRLAANLGRFWHLSGRGNEGRQWLRHALQVASDTPTSARALALNWAGRLATVNGESDDLRLLEDSVDQARAVGDPAVLAMALRHLSMASQRHGELAAARLGLEEALVAARQAGDRREEAFALVSLGASAEQAGDHERAADLLQAGLAAAREVGDAGPVGWALSVLGSIAAGRGHDDEASSLLHAALELSQPMGYWAVTVASLAQLGGLACAQRDLDTARQHALRCLAVAQTSGDLGLMAAALTFAADVELRAGRYVAGVRLLGAESAWRTAAPARRFVSFWSWPLPPTDDARVHLGHEAFERAWRAGAGLGLQEAVREAMEERLPHGLPTAASHRTDSRRGHVSLRPSHPSRALAGAR